MTRVFLFFALFLCFTNSYSQQIDSLLSLINLPVDTREEYDVIKKLRGVTISLKTIQDPAFYPIVAYYESADQWAQKNESETEIYATKIALLSAYVRVDDFEKAVRLGAELLLEEDSFTANQLEEFVYTLNFYYGSKELHRESLLLIPLMQKVVDRDTTNLDLTIAGYTENFDIGYVYYRMKDYSSAIPFFRKQIKTFDHAGNQLMKSSMLNNIGLCQYNLRKFDSAEIYFDKAIIELSIPDKEGVNPNKPERYNAFFEKVIIANIADVKVESGDFQFAIKAYNDELVNQPNSGGRAILKTDALTKLSRVYFLMNNHELALTIADSAELSLLSYDKPEAFIELYDIKGKILLSLGQLDKAMGYFNKLNALKDSVDHIRVKRNAQVTAAKFYFDQQERELKEVNQKMLESEKIRLIQLVGSLIILAFLVILFMLYKKTKRNGKLVEQQKNKLAESLIEKEVLLKEIQHRVKNNLQVVSSILQLQQVKNKTSSSLLSEVQTKVESMLIVHQMLHKYDNVSAVNMDAYLNRLVSHLSVSFEAGNIDIETKAENVLLDIQKASPIGLIINELLTNSFKYAFPDGIGKISISIKEPTPGNFKLIYKDDGIGLPQDYMKKDKDSQGFYLIKMLTQEINGDLVIDGSNGVELIIQFKSS